MTPRDFPWSLVRPSDQGWINTPVLSQVESGHAVSRTYSEVETSKARGVEAANGIVELIGVIDLGPRRGGTAHWRRCRVERVVEELAELLEEGRSILTLEAPDPKGADRFSREHRGRDARSDELPGRHDHDVRKDQVDADS